MDAPETNRTLYIDESGSPVSGPEAGEAEEAWGAPAVSPTALLGQLWCTGVLVGAVLSVLGLLMLLAKGLAAVVLWPLGTLTAILGGSLMWAAVSAQRATRRLTRQMRLQGP